MSFTGASITYDLRLGCFNHPEASFLVALMKTMHDVMEIQQRESDLGSFLENLPTPSRNLETPQVILLMPWDYWSTTGFASFLGKRLGEVHCWVVKMDRVKHSPSCALFKPLSARLTVDGTHVGELLSLLDFLKLLEMLKQHWWSSKGMRNW